MNNSSSKIDGVILANLLLVVKMMLSSSSLVTLNEWVGTGFDLTILMLICSKLMKQKYSKKEFLFISIVGVLCSYSSIVVGNFYLLFAFLFIISMKGVNLQCLLSYRVLVKIGIISIHVLMFVITYIFFPNKISPAIRNGVIRYDFFLGQPNTCQMYVLWTSIELLFVIYNRLKAGHLCLIMGVNVLFYLVTNSNTSILLCFIIMAFILGEKYNIKCIKRIYNGIASKGFGILAVIFAIIASSYGSVSPFVRVLYVALDKVFTGRIAYGGYAYHVYGFSFLGQKISFPGLAQWNGQWFDDLYLDNGYLWLLLGYGIIHILIIAWLLFKYTKYMTEFEKISVAAMVLFGITEGYILDVSKCFSLLILGSVYYCFSSNKRCIDEQ